VPSGQVEGADGEVSEGGHGPRPGAGADGGVVFAVKGVAQPVQGLDRPLAADEFGDGLGGWRGWRRGW
jgi:hypothetical protein